MTLKQQPQYLPEDNQAPQIAPEGSTPSRTVFPVGIAQATGTDIHTVLEGSPAQTLLHEISKHSPTLAKIIRSKGNSTVYDFIKNVLTAGERVPEHLERQRSLIAVIKSIIGERLDIETADQLAAQLAINPVISTTDHHGILNDPYFVSTNLLMASAGREAGNMRHIPILSFSNVSLSNESYPRGIQVHGDEEGKERALKLPLFPDRLKMGSVYSTRAIEIADLEKLEKNIEQKIASGVIEIQRGKKLLKLIEKCLRTPAVLSAPDFAHQITKVNYQLWKELFKDADGTAPDLIYIEIETIVREMLIAEHLNNPESPVHKLLCNQEFQELALIKFDGIPGAFSVEHGSGTYMFWGVDKNGHRVTLHLDQGTITNNDDITIKLDPESIKNALLNKEIFPNMSLCYLMISLYYGMNCLGGFCQVNDLTRTKKAWIDILQATGGANEAANVERVNTEYYGGDGMVISYLKDSEGNLAKATGFDIALSDEKKDLEDYAKLTRAVSVKEIIKPSLPGIYAIQVAANERDPELSAIREDEILTGSKIKEVLQKFAV